MISFKSNLLFQLN